MSQITSIIGSPLYKLPVQFEKAMTEAQSQQWLWQHPQWPNFEWQDAKLQPLLRRAYDCLGQLKGRMASVEGHEQFTLDALLANIVASSAIESEKLDVYAVRSSLARQLGIDDQNPVRVSEQSDGLASLMRDAVTSWQQPISLATIVAMASVVVSRSRVVITESATRRITRRCAYANCFRASP